MSDHASWLEEWCPDCQAAPGTRCAGHRLTKRTLPSSILHFARGWRYRSCPTCRVVPGEVCRTPSGREASGPHTARLRRGRHELTHNEAWTELERRGVTVASVPFTGIAGAGGETRTITLWLLGGRSIEIWSSEWREELASALEAPVWDRFGSFAGHPRITGTVTWTTADRTLTVSGRRRGERFKEVL